MKSTGLIFKARSYTGSIEPPATVLDDVSRFGNNGAFLGDGEPNWVQLPSGLWVMEFDGTDDHVDLGNGVSLQGLTKFTVLIWLYSDDTTTDRTAIGKGELFADDSFRIQNQGGDVYVSARWGAATVQALTAMSQDAWHHVGLRYSDADDNLQLYLDGAYINQDTLTDFVGNKDQSLYLGRPQDGGYYWDGRLTLPKIYNYVLTPGRIKQIFEAERQLFGV